MLIITTDDRNVVRNGGEWKMIDSTRSEAFVNSKNKVVTDTLGLFNLLFAHGDSSSAGGSCGIGKQD